MARSRSLVLFLFSISLLKAQNPIWIGGSGGGGSSTPALSVVTGSAQQATGTEVAPGDGYTFGGVETTSSVYPFVFSNSNAGGNFTGALGVFSPNGTAQIPLMVAQGGSGGFLAVFELGTFTNNLLAETTREFTFGSTGVERAAYGVVLGAADNCTRSSAFLLCQQEGTGGASASGYAALWPHSGDHTYHWSSNAAADQHLPQVTILSGAAYTNATTGFTTVVGGAGQTLQVAVNANANYTGTCHISWSTGTATGGPKFQFTGPASPTAIQQYAHIPQTTSTYIDAPGSLTTFSSVMSSGTTVTTSVNFDAIVTFGLLNGANAGTVVLQAAAQGVGTLTINPGSFCIFQ